MDANRFDRALQTLVASVSRRRSVVGMLGGLLAASRLEATPAAKKRRKRKAGPGGPPGPPGPPGSDFASVIVPGAFSTGLGAAAGDERAATASCGGAGKVLGCGHEVATTTGQSPHLFVRFIGPELDGSGCRAIVMGTDAAAAGATIRAIAVCRP